MPQISLLQGGLKHYEWGGFDFIPALLNMHNSLGKPCAEYWLGSHPQSDCYIIWPNGKRELLSDFISNASKDETESYVHEHLGTLPFLLKVLDVRDMLSIQVHPTQQAAHEHFDRENSLGIPLHAANRNYKDCNHKPELMVSLSDFWLLHGFKPETLLLELLHEIQELRTLIPHFKNGSFAGLYKHVMEMPQQQVNEVLQPLLARIIPLYNQGTLHKDSEHFWAARAALTFNKGNDIDRGIFSIYLFNLVNVPAGKAIFQDAGVPHAYLEGQNVEIMANSDNVLRGGLTSKHIDVSQLLLHTKCEETVPVLLDGDKMGAEHIFNTPAPDFQLSIIKLEKGETCTISPQTAEILLVLPGKVQITCYCNSLILEPGNIACLLLPGVPVLIEAYEQASIYRARAPINIR